MKKIVCVLCVCFPSYITAVSINAQVSAFFPTAQVTQKIYGTVWPEFALVFDHIQPFNKVEQLSLFAQVDYLFSKGKSLCFKQPTHIRLVPITVGFKWIQPVHDYVDVYAGLAPKFYFMQVKNDSAYVPASSQQKACGVYVTGGAFFYPQGSFVVQLFFSYSYIKFRAPCSTASYTGFGANISGFNLGAGFGWKF